MGSRLAHQNPHALTLADTRSEPAPIGRAHGREARDGGPRVIAVIRFLSFLVVSALALALAPLSNQHYLLRLAKTPSCYSSILTIHTRYVLTSVA